MDKCREAFEEWCFKSGLVLNKRFFKLNGQDDEVSSAWLTWQSLQAEVDQQKLLTRDSELHLDAAKEEIERLKGVVNERDKQIEEALYVLKGLKAENDLWGCDQVEVQIEILEKALRGEQ